MEITAMEGLQTLPEGDLQIWRRTLHPAGEKREGLILAEVESSPGE